MNTYVSIFFSLTVCFALCCLCRGACYLVIYFTNLCL